MNEKIFDYGYSASDVRVARGWFAVDPYNNLILVPVHSPLKSGWRVATEDDIAAKRDGNSDRDPAPEQVQALPIAPSDAGSDGRTSDDDSDGREANE